MTEKLNFGNTGSDPLGGFDAAPNPNDADLSGFDSATGITTIPAGNYICRIERGELAQRKPASPPTACGSSLWTRPRSPGSRYGDGFLWLMPQALTARKKHSPRLASRPPRTCANPTRRSAKKFTAKPLSHLK